MYPSPYEEAMQELQTIADFLRFGISEASKEGLFYGHGTDNVQDDIWALVLGSLFLPPDTEFMLLQSRLTTAEKSLLVERLMSRILDKVPVPYLTNTAYFCGLPFYIDKRALIPRSPIAELINKHFSPWIIDPTQVQHVLDLCTGSACIAIACKYAFPDAAVDAVDISSDALDVAAINAEKYGLDEESGFQLIQSDCWDKVPNILYDIIISNPPYVGDEEMEALPEEYLHEPDMALRTEHNGLFLVEKILEKADNYLSEDGILVVEVGNSEEALIAAYPDLDFTWLEFEQGGQGVFLLTAEQLKAYFANRIRVNS
jgi:ribosomal protein L3 glutamine methyltransferase